MDTQLPSSSPTSSSAATTDQQQVQCPECVMKFANAYFLAVHSNVWHYKPVKKTC